MKKGRFKNAIKQLLGGEEHKWVYKRLSNPRFVKVCSTFSLLYFTWIYSTRNHDNQLLRIGASGSLTFLLCEMCFFPFDTLNF